MLSGNGIRSGRRGRSGFSRPGPVIIKTDVGKEKDLDQED